MNSEHITPPFHVLFNLFRLRSGYETLTKFGEALNQEGFIYEDSLFSRWKNGSRQPKDRKLILAIITVFIKAGGIVTIADANLLLESLDQRDLKTAEIINLFGWAYLVHEKTFPFIQKNRAKFRYTYRSTIPESILLTSHASPYYIPQKKAF